MPYPDYEPEKRRFAIYCFYAVPAFVGSVFLTDLVKEARQYYSLTRTGTVANGVITSATNRSFKNGTSHMTLYAVRFTDPKTHRTHSFSTYSTLLSSGYRAGEAVQVVYEPAQPEQARLRAEQYGTLLADALAVALVVSMLGFIYFSFHRPFLRQQKAQAHEKRAAP